jgi:hypothetical protein
MRQASEAEAESESVNWERCRLEYTEEMWLFACSSLVSHRCRQWDR